MKKLFLFLSVFAWLISANAAYADVTAPNVTIQNGGAVSVVWNAPISQSAKVSVFIPNNATAINALYHVYPNGKSTTNTACLSTDATKPCFEIPLNQALNKNKWVQLTLNNDVNTQWTFVKNTGFVTVASNNLGASENLGVAGADFSVSALSTKQIAAKWAKAIAAASGIKKAIGRCMLDNGGFATGICDSAWDDPTWGLGKYGIFQSALTTMNAAPGTESLIAIGTAYGADATTMISIDITEAVSGRLGGCSFHLVPTRGVGTILWQVLAKMESAPAITDADCTKFVSGSMRSSTTLVNSYGGDYSYVSKIGAKWAKAIAAASGIKKAITQCLKDNGGTALDLCDSAGWDMTSHLGKYGILQFALDAMNSASNAETAVSISTMFGADVTTMVSIDITGGYFYGKLGGCSFHLVPTRGVGTILWQVLAKMESPPATTDFDCTKFVKGSLPSTTVLTNSYGDFQNAFRAKWAKAIAAASGIKKAINQCLKDNGGVVLGVCDSAGFDATTALGKYGILQTGLDTMNAAPDAQTQISIGNSFGYSSVSIDIREATAGRLGGCSFHLIPTLVNGNGGAITWHIAAELQSAPAISDSDCVQYVKGSEALSGMALDGIYGGGYAFQAAFRAKWAKAIAAASGIKKAINQCLKNNGGIALNRCDSAGADSNTTLGKFGILQTALDTMNYAQNAETTVSISSTYGVDSNTLVSIDITENMNNGNYGRLGGCSFHLVPTVQGGAGTILWQVLARMETAPATMDEDCVSLVRGSLPSWTTLSSSSNGYYAFQSVFRARWSKTLSTVVAVRRAITRCLINNAGDKTQCDSVLIVKDKLQKYGISSLPAGTESSDGASSSDSTANWVSMKMGNAGASDAAIVVQGGSQLADCKVTLHPSYNAGAKYVKWTLFAQATNALADDAKCASFVNGAIAGAPI